VVTGSSKSAIAYTGHYLLVDHYSFTVHPINKSDKNNFIVRGRTIIINMLGLIVSQRERRRLSDKILEMLVMAQLTLNIFTTRFIKADLFKD